MHLKICHEILVLVSILEVVVVSKGLIAFITGSKVRTAGTTLSGNLYLEIFMAKENDKYIHSTK